MVKRVKKIALLLAGASILFAGCSGLVGGTVTSENKSSFDGNLSVKLGSDSEVSRSIMPATLTTEGIEYFKISGISLDGSSVFTEKTIKDAEDVTDKTDLLAGNYVLTKVGLDDWNFTLSAYDSSDNLLLTGTSYCAIKSSGETTVTFNISSNNVNTAGSYEVAIKYTGTGWQTNKYSFTWALYNTVTGECLTNAGATNGTPTNIAAGTTTNTAAEPPAYSGADAILSDDGKTVSATGVTPGTYQLGVWLKNGDKNLNFASDVLVIEPGRKTTGTLEIKSVIPTAPVAPTDLKAQRIYPSTDAEKNADSKGFYNVRFIWTDASDNETEFKMIIKEFTDTTTKWASITADTDLSTIDGITVYSFSNVYTKTADSDAIKYIAGSLYAGSSELVLRFPTGHMYDVQIIAANDIGSSAGTVRVTDATTGATTPASLTAAAAGNPATVTTTTITSPSTLVGKTVSGYDVAASAPYKHITLTRLLYNLNGGTLKTAANVTYSGTTYIEYKVYGLDTTKTNGTSKTDRDDDEYKLGYLPLMETKTVESGNYPTLVNSLNKESTGWIAYNATDGSYETVFATDTYKDFSVTAVYDPKSRDITVGTITIEELPALADTRIQAFYGTDSTGTTNSTVAKDATISIPRGSAAKYLTVKVGPAAADTTVFVQYKLFIKGAYTGYTIDASESSTIVFPTVPVADYFVKGAQTEVMVVGITAGGREASSKFNVKVSN